MSLGLPPVSWELHERGIALLLLDKEEGYYKIFGGPSAQAADFQLACIASWLQNPTHPERKGGPQEYKRVYNDIQNDLDTIIESIDVSSDAKRLQENYSILQRLWTVQRYARNQGLLDDAASLRAQMQSYKTLLENILAGRTLTPAEDATRVQFCEFVNFFRGLEARYGERVEDYNARLHEALE